MFSDEQKITPISRQPAMHRMFRTPHGFMGFIGTPLKISVVPRVPLSRASVTRHLCSSGWPLLARGSIPTSSIRRAVGGIVGHVGWPPKPEETAGKQTCMPSQSQDSTCCTACRSDGTCWSAAEWKQQQTAVGSHVVVVEPSSSGYLR